LKFPIDIVLDIQTLLQSLELMKVDVPASLEGWLAAVGEFLLPVMNLFP